MRRTYEDGYTHPIEAKRKGYVDNVFVRKMGREEMPDDGVTYYADTNCNIYQEDELELLATKQSTNNEEGK